jgi:hypothetical protein
MARVCLEFLAEPRIESRSALRLRRALESTCGVEAISISIKRQVIWIEHNPLFLDADAIGEKLARLGFVIRPAAP